MKTLGLVQRFGVGIATAQKAMAQNGNPPIQWDVNDRFVLAILPRRS
jgi:ATP-dependent DNA helicase RecG